MAHLNFIIRLARSQVVLTAIFGMSSTLTVAQASPDAELDGPAIIRQFIESQSSTAEMAFIRMQTLLKGERVDERRFLALYQKNEDASADYLVRLVRPTDVEGVTVLSTADAAGEVRQSIFLPAVGIMRPLQGGAQAASFLGSDFSYADLIKEIPGSQDYTRGDDAFVQGANCYVVKATPRDDSGPYGFRELYIDQATFLLIRIDYYDEGDKLIKQLNCYDYQSPEIFGNSTRPHRTVMTNSSKGTATIFTVIVGRLNEPVPQETFTAKFIENWTADAVDDFMFELSFKIGTGAN